MNTQSVKEDLLKPQEIVTKSFSYSQIKCGISINKETINDKKQLGINFLFFLKSKMKYKNNAANKQTNKYFDKKPKAENMPNKIQFVLLFEFMPFQKK